MSWEVDTELLDLKELESQIAEFVDRSNVEEVLKIQLAEFEMLQSMFSNPGELNVDDHSVLADFNNYLEGKTTLIPPQLDFTINLQLNSNKLEVCVNLPLEYPNLEPDIFVRSETLNRNQQHALNNKFAEYVSSLERGEICICLAISWLQENALEYFDNTNLEISNEILKPSVQDGEDVFNRLWIYSHHIYSKTKRREILDLANEYNVTGFCMPGRPGIICVEGLASDCEKWWYKVRCMNWKKIMCKKKEEDDLSKGIKELQKFPDFREISFEANKGKRRDYHMDFGEFYKYLTDHGCDYIFKDYFGIDGKCTAFKS